MPELPEVETVKNVLKPVFINRKIIKIDVLRASTIKMDVDEFITTLTDRTFLDITRIGKFLIFHLDNNLVLISHLRMEGKYYELLEEDKDSKYARVVFHLDNNHKVCYDDSRCFGMMKLSIEKEYKDVKDIAQLGPEPFDIEDINYLIKRTKNSNHAIKSTLLDQTLMTGLGNIYADEVLFASKIHPLTPAKMITKEQWIQIVDNSKRILNEAIKQGGSTIKSYHPGKDIDGNFQVNLKAYGRSGKECLNCSHIMRFKKVNGRGSSFCPICQKKKGAPIYVAIYGKVASGKSTVLNAFKKAGYPTISSDDIVAELYQKQEVINKINQMFKLNFIDHVDKEVLKEYLIRNPKDINRLNRLVHPLVKKEIFEYFNWQNSTIFVAEVPLLYESKMDNLFDYIIAVDINEDKQLSNLLNRDKKSVGLLKINQNHKFDENKNKADIIIYNNADLNNLNKQIKEIINELQSRLD